MADGEKKPPIPLKERRAASAARRQASENAAKPESVALEESELMSLRWLEHFTGPTMPTKQEAARMAGYEESKCHDFGVRNFRKFAYRLTDMIEARISKNELVDRLLHQADGIARYRVWDLKTGKENWPETLKRVIAAGADDLLESVKKDTKGQQIVSTPSTQAALFKLIDISGITAPVKIDLSNVPRAELEKEGDKYILELQQLALMGNLVAKKDGDDTSEADTRGD